ncbi:MAG: hypothetical protein OM95_15285 [Bdellovibrio sp. ArHS]|uniref:hypothetical protein n=1 Tax=Bdellovibrio sp. ArHS TaxID=1569284 RepID=UPI0005835A62|nr:hypothetical protein [Bdellovibrio sp. ArHS]KHD87302.1 MAG: hypothetical protein OM95_15285 [Bdellovibrio sp. ArHS]
MKLHLSLISKVCFILTIICGSWVLAQEESATLVEVEVVQDNLAPYKDRRETHGMYIGVDYEGLDLKNYISTLDNLGYADLFGSDPIPLIRFNIDYKYNFALGAVALGVDYGMGKIEDNRSGTDRSLEVTKYGVGIKYVIDNIMPEPYLAPYLGLNIWQMSLAESSPTDSFSATTQMGYNYTLGVLLQLDWLDYDTAKQTTFNWGMENTFIDLYATQYAATSAADDPDTTTDFLYGAGLRIEF